MFRILCDPSSGSTELCLTGITVVWFTDILSYAWSVFGSVILNLWFVCVCVYGRDGRSQPAVSYTHTTVIPVKHSSVLPDDGSHKIRNMSE